MLKKKKIYPAYVSKAIFEKQVILLMIPNGEGRKKKSKGQWHCLAVKIVISIIKRNNIKNQW